MEQMKAGVILFKSRRRVGRKKFSLKSVDGAIIQSVFLSPGHHGAQENIETNSYPRGATGGE